MSTNVFRGVHKANALQFHGMYPYQFDISLYDQKCHTFPSWKIEEWHRLMMEVLHSCHSATKEQRLECLHLLVVQALKV